MRSRRAPNPFLFLVDAIVWRYRSCARFDRKFVRGKLRYDPVYRELLTLPVWNEPGPVVDLGCGRGILLVTLLCAYSLGRLDSGKACKPQLYGVELDAAHADVARCALGNAAVVVTGDARTLAVPPSRVILLIDLLYHLPVEEQDALLAKAAAALLPGGALLLREADAGAGLRFVTTWLAEALARMTRRTKKARRHYRSTEAWRSALENLGLEVEARPMSEGTPFSNVLLLCRKPEPAR